MIALKDLTAFLPHVGARLGFYEDPPCASFCVEGGRFGGAIYVGAVFSPDSPAAAAVRIDAVIANPASGLLELIAGEEGSASPPDLSSYAGVGVVVFVAVHGRDNGKVLIERSHVEDQRSVVPANQGAFQVLDVRTIGMGSAAMLPAVGSKIGAFNVIATKVWTQGTASVKNVNQVMFGNSLTWVDLEFDRVIADFHLVVQLYGALIAAAPKQAGDHPNGVGVTWMPLDSVGGKPRVRIVVGAANGSGTPSPTRVFTLTEFSPPNRPLGGPDVQVHVQAWGRV